MKKRYSRKKRRGSFIRFFSSNRNVFLPVLVLLLIAILQTIYQSRSPTSKSTPNTVRDTADREISCLSPHIIDGDTFDCGDVRIRLANIDAPELSECRPGRKCVSGDPVAAKRYLKSITRGRVDCRQIDTDHYGRIVALCENLGQDLSCQMVENNYAIERYGSLSCP